MGRGEGQVYRVENYERTLARSQAMQLLFQAEAQLLTVDELLDRGDYALSKGPLDDYAEELALGASRNRIELDRLISEASERWELSRMPAVDRNLLRVAVYEMLYVDDLPSAITIDEAVEVAKAFGTDDSSKFINGVLGRIARDQELGIEADDEPADEPEVGETAEEQGSGDERGA